MRASRLPVNERPSWTYRLRVDVAETLLQAAGWTYADLGREMQFDQANVSRLMRGHTRLGLQSMASMLVAFRKQFGDRITQEMLFELVPATAAGRRPPPTEAGPTDRADEPAATPQREPVSTP